MLIRGAEVWRQGIADVRLAGGVIEAIGALAARPGETVIDVAGGALLPGLHDQHIHLAGLAARAGSIACGPPQVDDARQLAAALRPGSGWLRGVGYHESVMGLPDARALDRLCPDRPLRIQHRSGRLWLVNSRALDELLKHAKPPSGMERDASGFTGHLFDADEWLRTALESTPPDFAAISAELARYGVTGITDMSPRNDPIMAAHFARQIDDGSLVQHVMLAGTLSLGEAASGPWRPGPAKLHLHEAALPGFDEARRFVEAAHGADRAVAIHCVSEVELVFALALFEESGAIPGDRIEHASIASPELVARIAALGLAVCVQPHFVFERGDRYLADVEPRHHPDLYRLRSLAEAGLALAGGSDAPFGEADPWAAMRAAVTRHTRGGLPITPDEALTPEQALGLFLKHPARLGEERAIVAGAPADLCLLDRPWAEQRAALDSDAVRACWVSGRLVHQGIYQPPFERAARR